MEINFANSASVRDNKIIIKKDNKIIMLISYGC